MIVGVCYLDPLEFVPVVRGIPLRDIKGESVRAQGESSPPRSDRTSAHFLPVLTDLSGVYLDYQWGSLQPVFDFIVQFS